MMKANPFGKFIRDRRTEAKLSLRDVAAQLDISHVYLGEVERGVRPPFLRERWPDLIRAIPTITMEQLQRMAAQTAPIQLDLTDAPPQYADLGLALARRIDKQDLSDTDFNSLFTLLGVERKK